MRHIDIEAWLQDSGIYYYDQVTIPENKDFKLPAISEELNMFLLESSSKQNVFPKAKKNPKYPAFYV